MPSVRSTSSSDYQIVKGDISVSGNGTVASFVINDEIYMFPFTSEDPLHTQAILTYDSSMRISGLQRFEARIDKGMVAIQLNNNVPSIGIHRKPSRKTGNVRTEVGWMKGIPLRNSYPVA